MICLPSIHRWTKLPSIQHHRISRHRQGVQQAAQQDTDTAAKVRPDGKNSDAEQNASEEKKRNDENETETEPRKQWEIKDPRVGNFIDISR